MTNSSQSTPDEAPAVVPQTTPPAIGYGHPEYQFVQAIMEMQKSIGEVKGSIEGLRKSVDDTKSKIDNLVAWKHKILGGAAVLGTIITLMGFVIGKFWNYFSFQPPTHAIEQSIPYTSPPSEPHPNSK